MTVPKFVVDDATILPMVTQTSDLMLKLVDHMHQLLIQYLALMDCTQTGILPPKATSNGIEGKWVLKRTKKPAMKPSESKTTQPTKELIVETVEPIAEKVPIEIIASIEETLT
ncbi:unnamed protein product [Lactuca saligna]|uniref:Uncharacterized protein n=1 Tax=Lactuca saligna TaxID=75948 RepID=A0AA36EJL1_LACSI|nr:unnamed protein product [Lactuca saligna]